MTCQSVRARGGTLYPGVALSGSTQALVHTALTGKQHSLLLWLRNCRHGSWFWKKLNPRLGSKHSYPVYRITQAPSPPPPPQQKKHYGKPVGYLSMCWLYKLYYSNRVEATMSPWFAGWGSTPYQRLVPADCATHAIRDVASTDLICMFTVLQHAAKPSNPKP